MVHHLRSLFYYLWIAPHALQIVILIVLLKRGLHKRVPVFSIYVGFSLFEFFALFFISRTTTHLAYFRWYSSFLGINIALFFGIIFDIMGDAFEHHEALQDLGKPFVRWAAVSILIITFSFAIYGHRSDSDPLWFADHVIERSANIVQSILILALFLFSSHLGLAWNKPLFGIALGVGILTCVGLAIAALRYQMGPSTHLAFDLIDMGTYHVCVLIWLFYLLAPERTRLRTDADLPPNDLAVWNTELEQLLHR